MRRPEMTDNAIVQGSYTTFKHIKTRKVVVLEVEVAEEYFEEVISKLGMPIGGESKPVAIALLKASNFKYEVENGEYHPDVIRYGKEFPTPLNTPNVYSKEQTEGEKLRVRAIMLCKDKNFQEYIGCHIISHLGDASESECARYIKIQCQIKSRSELATNIGAQDKFKILLEDYKNWQFEQSYKDNLSQL